MSHIAIDLECPECHGLHKPLKIGERWADRTVFLLLECLYCRHVWEIKAADADPIYAENPDD